MTAITGEIISLTPPLRELRLPASLRLGLSLGDKLLSLGDERISLLLAPCRHDVHAGAERDEALRKHLADSAAY